MAVIALPLRYACVHVLHMNTSVVMTIFAIYTLLNILSILNGIVTCIYSYIPRLQS